MPRSTAAVLCAMLICAAGASAAPVSGPRLRSLGEDAERLIRDAVQRSPTVRSLAARIENTDLLVYVRLLYDPTRRNGSTRLLASSAGTRFVLVTVDPVAARIDLVPRLGHELQHVLEIADAADVHDAAGMRTLFERIGYRASAYGFETDAAVKVSRRIYDDLTRRPPRTETARR